MRGVFVRSFVVGMIPIIVLTTIALTQLGKFTYTELGRIMLIILAGYIVLLIPICILFFILRKKEIALGLLTSFGIGLFVTLFLAGMGT